MSGTCLVLDSDSEVFQLSTLLFTLVMRTDLPLTRHSSLVPVCHIFVVPRVAVLVLYISSALFLLSSDPWSHSVPFRSCLVKLFQGKNILNLEKKSWVQNKNKSEKHGHSGCLILHLDSKYSAQRRLRPLRNLRCHHLLIVRPLAAEWGDWHLRISRPWSCDPALCVCTSDPQCDQCDRPLLYILTPRFQTVLSPIQVWIMYWPSYFCERNFGSLGFWAEIKTSF